MSTSPLDRFYSRFGQWFAESGFSKGERSAAMQYLRRAAEDELPRRDGQYEAIIRDLAHSSELQLAASLPGLRVVPTPDGVLAAAVVGPDWGPGWSLIFKRKNLDHYLLWFFHLARQYVHRGRLTQIFGALALLEDRGVDFFGAWHELKRESMERMDPELALDELTRKRCVSDSHVWSGARSRRLQVAMASINGLDPYVQRAAHQLVRAIQLSDAGFDRESVIAMDGVVSVYAQLVQDRTREQLMDRASLARRLGADPLVAKSLILLNRIRSQQSAHPAQWKWWDFYEMFEGLLDSMLNAAKIAFWNVVTEERKQRYVDPNPAVWSQWFLANADMLFDVNWWGDLTG